MELPAQNLWSMGSVEGVCKAVAFSMRKPSCVCSLAQFLQEIMSIFIKGGADFCNNDWKPSDKMRVRPHFLLLRNAAECTLTFSCLYTHSLENIVY
jgi:hypothetical protein